MMRRTVLLFLCCVPLAWAGGPAPAAGGKRVAPSLQVTGAWVRAMPPVAKNSAGYLVIENAGGTDDALLGASVEGVRVVELHEMVRQGESMVMRRRGDVSLPAGSRLVLAPGGLHLMLIDLSRPLVAGETRAAQLRFREAGEVNVTLDVRAH